jgi:hypothetical protein
VKAFAIGAVDFMVLKYKKLIYNFSQKNEKRKSLRRSGHRREVNTKIDLKKWGMRMWSGFVWLRIISSDGRL